MEVITTLKYSREHEWVKVEDNKAYLGITDYAQHSLGDIVFVELPEIGTAMGEGDMIGVVESVKAASDIYSPVAGVVISVNTGLSDAPEKLNSDPYGSWITVLELSDPAQLDTLMDSEEYAEFCKKED